MGAIEKFVAYAAAFERAFAGDDWAEVEGFFHEDAVYVVGLGPPLGGRFEGRDAILAYFKAALDGFDRRFASRRVTLLEGPTEEKGVVRIRGRADYTAAGVPDLAFELDELVTFEDGRIRHLEDRYDAATQEALDRWLDAHGATLGLIR